MDKMQAQENAKLHTKLAGTQYVIDIKLPVSVSDYLSVQQLLTVQHYTVHNLI